MCRERSVFIPSCYFAHLTKAIDRGFKFQSVNPSIQGPDQTRIRVKETIQTLELVWSDLGLRWK